MKLFIRKIHFKKINSTSAYLLRRRFVLKNLTFVSSDYQINGRGRENRKWESNKGDNLLFSFLIKSKEVIDKFNYLSVATAYAIIKELDKYNIKGLSIKFPNDVYVFNKKLCGILLESISDDNKITSIVVGVGLNVNQTDFSNDFFTLPTSIKCELNYKINIKKLKKKIFSSIVQIISKIEQNDLSFMSDIREYDYLRNKIAFAEIEGKKQKVKILGITDDAKLKVLLNEKEYTLSYGEITFHI